MSSSIKKEIIKLLKEDEEFRYTVAGLIGLRELMESMKRVETEQTKIWEEIRELREEQKKLREDFNALREDFNKMLDVLRRMDVRLTRIEKTVEKITVDIEEEARAFIKHRLEEKGIRIEIDALNLPEAEINIYGANKEVCVIGEATIRAGTKILDEIMKKYKLLKTKYPHYLRDKVILVLYVLIPLPGLIEEAKKRNIWVLKATKEYVPLDKVLKNIK